MPVQTHIPPAPPLTHEGSLKSLVENRTSYTLDNYELCLYETYIPAKSVYFKFDQFMVASMLRGKKVLHRMEKDDIFFKPGQTAIVPPNAAVNIDFPDTNLKNPTQCLTLAIDNHKVAKTLDFLNERYPREGNDNFWKLNFDNFIFQNDEEIATILGKIISICQNDTFFKDVLADLSIQELLVKIVQSQSLQSAEAGDINKLSPQLQQVISLIRDNLNTRLDLKFILKKAGMSNSALYRLFKTELGISPREFIMTERIRLAKQFLSDKNTYIKNVCYEAGFEDSNYFIRAFKHYKGITPKQYQLGIRSKTND